MQDARRRKAFEDNGLDAKTRPIVPAESLVLLAPRDSTHLPRSRRAVRIEGDVIQFGLTEKEIYRVYQRLAKLQERIKSGKIGVLRSAADETETDG